jgi:hypothetical protein
MSSQKHQMLRVMTAHAIARIAFDPENSMYMKTGGASPTSAIPS